MRLRWLAVLLLPLLAPEPAWTKERAEPDPFERIRKRYGVYVIVRKEPLAQKWASKVISAEPADVEDVKTYARILIEEFCVYPLDFVKRTKLRQVVLCKNLKFGKQHRTAVPDMSRNIMYLDASRGRETEDYCRRVFHHELFHVVDYLDDGVLYADEGWSALNPEDFKYGSGGAAMRDDDAALLTDKYPGFLTKYCTSAIEEDKAETFSLLVYDHRHVMKRASKDKVLAAKVKYLKELVGKFSGDMSPRFWRARHRHRRIGD